MVTKTGMFSELPTDNMQYALKSILEEEELDPNTTKCIIKQMAAGNWTSSIYFVEAEDSARKISLYLKCLPVGKNKDKGEILNFRLHFENEVIFYSKVLPAFDNFQKEILGTETRPAISVPYCYKAEADTLNYVIIMENLFTKGFTILNRLEYMSIPEISLVLKELGRYHAFSLAMKVQQPENFRKLREQILLPLYNEDDYLISRDILYNALKDVLEAMKHNYEAESTYLRKYEHFIESRIQILSVQAKSDPANEPFNVINHGDLWNLNMMFHYGEGCKDPDDIRFLDFQQMRYSSPATDIGRLLFLSLDRTSRNKHRNDLLLCYYNSLSDTLQILGLMAEYLFPFSQLEVQLRKYAPFYIMNSIFNVVHSSEEYEEDGSDENTGNMKEYVINSIRTSQKIMISMCQKRVFEIIEECVDRGYME